MTHCAKVLWLLSAFAACNPAPAPERPKLVAQRVTATVKRETAWLVHLQTEHEALVTTPEHPFATPQAGWVPAGQLVPGDHVVSARDGTLRVGSVRQEQRAQPQAVFNLSVAPSHTYVVGTDQVLVHNKNCREREETEREKEKEIEAAERTREELRLQLALAAVEDKPALQQRVAELQQRITRLKRARAVRKWVEAKRRRAAGAEPEPSGPGPETDTRRSDAIGRNARALEALDREIGALAGTSPGSRQRLAELKHERRKFEKNLNALYAKENKKLGIVQVSASVRLLKATEADHESRSRAVEAAQRELSALLGEPPRSEEEKRSQAQRRAELEKKLETLRFEHEVSKELLAGEQRRAELAGRSPSTDAERQQIAAEQQALTDALAKQRLLRRRREGHRRLRSDPAVWAKRLEYCRQRWRGRLRTAEYEADTQRPRDKLELLEQELARRREIGSGALDARTESLSEHIALIKTLTELIRERDRSQSRLTRARMKRAQLSDRGQNTGAIEHQIARLVQKRDLEKIRILQLRLKEKLVERLDGTMSDAPGEMDEVRLRELERELAGELAAGGHLGEGRLREIQQELGEAELIDAEFLESIWREAEQEEEALREAVQDESKDVDALLGELTSSAEPPSPAPPAAVETGLQALQRELQEERNAVEAADFAFANEQAFLGQILGRPGSSQHAVGAPRLAELQQRRLRLRIDWRARMQGRLDAARRELRATQGGDPARQAELTRKIAVLEHEVNHPAF